MEAHAHTHKKMLYVRPVQQKCNRFCFNKDGGNNTQYFFHLGSPLNTTINRLQPEVTITVHGQIVSAACEKKYLVRFDNGVEKECSSNSFRVEKMHESLPPDVVPPLPSTNQERIEEELLDEAVADQDEERATRCRKR